jgi:hypothetical protein
MPWQVEYWPKPELEKELIIRAVENRAQRQKQQKEKRDDFHRSVEGSKIPRGRP